MSKKRKLRSDINTSFRNDDGKFAQLCGCIMHDTWSDDALYTVKNVKKSKKFSSKVIEDMRAQKVLSTYGNLVCDACYNRFKQR